MGDRYLRTIFAFLGITDFTTITAESLDVIGNNVDAIVGDTVKKAQAQAVIF